MRETINFFYNLLNASPKKWKPLLSVFYLTYACPFRCPYCSDGSGKQYYKLPNKTLDSESVIKIIGEIRKNCNSLVITGGEPLQHPGFKTIASKLKSFKFKEIILTTNGYDIEKYVDIIAANFTNLVVSVDTMNKERADKNYGYGPGTFKKILSNIELARKKQNRNFRINISSVATPGNIIDLYDVYNFASINKYTFALAPHLEGVKANKALGNDEEYIKFYNFLIKEKRNGGRIFGSELYLEHMRDLKKFRCHPFTMLVVSPLGDVFYPCLEIGNYAGNLLKESNINKIKANGLKLFGPQPDCDTRCHSACALSFGLLLKHPVSQIKEFIY